MSDLTHLFKVGQNVVCRVDDEMLKGTIKETYADHIIIDIPPISDHMYFDNDFIGDVYPDYNMDFYGIKTF